VARDFWSRGKAPTFTEFAAAWVESAQQHKRPNPEWAYLSDRAQGANTQNWKRLRARKAAEVLAQLKQLVSTS
jgi:hypothetical protein